MTTDCAALDLAALRERLRYANSYSRLPILVDLAWSCEWADWVTVLGEEWSGCDNVAQWAQVLLDETPLGEIADDPKSLRDLLMTEQERSQLRALPEIVTIWRGCYAHNKWGLSWSLDRAVAAKFPTNHRYQQEGQPLLVKARVRRDEIIALKNDRGEAEIIAVRPKHVSTSHIAPD